MDQATEENINLDIEFQGWVCTECNARDFAMQPEISKVIGLLTKQAVAFNLVCFTADK